jgi:hypothetical protein
MQDEPAWYSWFKLGAKIAAVALIIYAVTMAFITAPK